MTKRRGLNILSYVLAVVAALTLAAYVIIRWADTRILNTDSWVATVAPLPKDPVVASALGSYTVSTILDQTNAEDQIKQVLPPRAAFLAPPIYDEINTRANKLAANFISSDQFQSIWVGANRLAISTLLASTRGEQASPNPKGQTKIQLGLNQLKSVLVGKVGSISSSNASEGIAVGLKTSIVRFKFYVRSADFLNAVLPFVVLASILGSVATATRKRNALLRIFGGSAILSLVMLIALRLSKSAVVGEVRRPVYRPAVTKILDGLSANLKSMIINLLILSVVIIVLALIGHYLNKTFKQRAFDYTKLKSYRMLSDFRVSLGKYFIYILGAAACLALLFLAFTTSPIGWAIIINSLSTVSVVASLLVMLRLPRPQPQPVLKKSRAKKKLK